VQQHSVAARMYEKSAFEKGFQKVKFIQYHVVVSGLYRVAHVTTALAFA